MPKARCAQAWKKVSCSSRTARPALRRSSDVGASSGIGAGMSRSSASCKQGAPGLRPARLCRLKSSAMRSVLAPALEHVRLQAMLFCARSSLFQEELKMTVQLGPRRAREAVIHQADASSQPSHAVGRMAKIYWGSNPWDLAYRKLHVLQTAASMARSSRVTNKSGLDSLA